MMMKTLSLVRPSLLKLRYGCQDLSKATTIPPNVLEFFQQPPQAKLDPELRFALTPDALYASTDALVHVQSYARDERFRVLFMGRAKGAGFVEIGPEWGRGLVAFDDGYTAEGREQANSLAIQLEELLGYTVEEQDYGADF